MVQSKSYKLFSLRTWHITVMSEFELRHAKTGLKLFAAVIRKEEMVGGTLPILLLVIMTAITDL